MIESGMPFVGIDCHGPCDRCGHAGDFHSAQTAACISEGICGCTCYVFTPVWPWPTHDAAVKDRLDVLEGLLREVKSRCDCRWADTSEELDELGNAPAALPEGAVVLSRMPTPSELGDAYRAFEFGPGRTGGTGVDNFIRSLVVPS